MKYTCVKYSIFFSMFLLLLSCNDANSPKKEKMQNSSIATSFHDKLQGLDSLLLFYGDGIKKNEYKIIIYFNGTCSTCISEMLEWEKLLKTIIINDNFAILFITYTEEKDILSYYFERDEIAYPIYFDLDSTFIKTNSLVDISHIAFIVDSTNKIIYRGDPLKDSITEDDFIGTILKINTVKGVD